MSRIITVESGGEPTKDQLAEVEEAKKQPIVFDEDCPELSPALMKAFQCEVSQRNRRNA